jgi:hypothetical protein
MHNLPHNSDGGNKNSFGLARITSMMGAAARVDIVAFTEALDPIRLCAGHRFEQHRRRTLQLIEIRGGPSH